MSKPTLSYYPELMLKCAGLHPHEKSKILFFYHHYVNCFFFVFLSVLAILEVIFFRNNIFRAIEGLSSVFFMTYTFFRYLLSYYHKAALAELLQEQSKFWKVENFDPRVRTESELILISTSKFIYYYKNYALTLAAIFYIQPFLFGELQMKIYVPDGWFYCLYFVYWYMTPPLFVSVYGVTSMFCALCVPVVIQFKLLDFQFQILERGVSGKGRQEVKELVDYHNFLIGYCGKINNYANGVFLFEYFITVAVCCILIFIASNDYPLIDKIKYVGFILSQFLDTAIFCYNAELISEASQNVGNAVYNSKWYNSEPFRRDIVMVITRTQKKVSFSGYGLVQINMMTFTQVFKATLSFVSYLNTVTEK